MVNRRAAIRAVLGPLVTLTVAIGSIGGASTASAAPAVSSVAPAGVVSAVVATAPAPTPPTTIVNEFLPEDENLSDCLGALERPGCGSKARGGWRQTLVFAMMLAGLAVVFGRVGYGIYRNRT